KFPNSITKIGNYAFFFCLGLEEIKLPRNLKSIGDYAFMNVSKVKYIVIPKSVEDVGIDSFAFGSHDGRKKKIFLERKRVPKNWKSWHFDNVFIYLKNRWEYDENGIPVVKWMNEEEAYSFLEENKRL
ncbi:MAG TPA: leucine-rich repeat domain-containing protein, partial [Bacilli bacterium]|nr:leucine-rich repeat domain-containing protein [Bacilli bacterium]